jgi:hypothetical protein
VSYPGSRLFDLTSLDTMNLVLLFFATVLMGVTPPAPPAAQTVAECPAPTAHGRRLVTQWASSDNYTSSRNARGISRVAAEEVRPLTDGSACGRLRAFLEQQAVAAGGSLAGSRPEFYRVGAYYYAVLPAEPSRCKAPPGQICISTRWQALDVFDSELKHLASVAI